MINKLDVKCEKYSKRIIIKLKKYINSIKKYSHYLFLLFIFNQSLILLFIIIVHRFEDCRADIIQVIRRHVRTVQTSCLRKQSNH